MVQEFTKIVLIGGHPKGFDYAFHESTRSGKFLRGLVKKLNLEKKTIYFDIWNNQEEEDSGVIQDFDKSTELFNFVSKNYELIALGLKVRKAMKYEGLHTINLPHPASCHPTDRLKLENGLKKLVSVNENKL